MLNPLVRYTLHLKHKEGSFIDCRSSLEKLLALPLYVVFGGYADTVLEKERLVDRARALQSEANRQSSRITYLLGEQTRLQLWLNDMGYELSQNPYGNAFSSQGEPHKWSTTESKLFELSDEDFLKGGGYEPH